MLGSGDGVGRHKMHTFRQMRLNGLNNVALNRAHIRNCGPRFQSGCDILGNTAHRANRHAKHDQIGTFNPVVEWHKSSWVDTPASRNSASAPIVVQLNDDNQDGMINDDDMPDVVTVTWSNAAPAVLRAVSGDGQTELLNLQAPGLNRNMSVTGADIDNDGIVELLTVTNTKQVICWEHDGTLKWTSAGLGANVSSYDNTPSVSDMDMDGVPEIVVGRAILDNMGQLIAAGQYTARRGMVVLSLPVTGAEIDRFAEAFDEVIGLRAGIIAAVWSASGSASRTSSNRRASAVSRRI